MSNYPTSEQIDAWKKQHGIVQIVELEDGRKIWLKKPDRNVVSLAMTKSRTDALGMVTVILASCYLAGDDVSQDAGALVGLQGKVDDLIGSVNVEVKNC